MKKMSGFATLVFKSHYGKRVISVRTGVFLTVIAIVCLMTQTNYAQMSGQELLRVTRVAQGGSEYAGLQYITARSKGFVNVAPFGAVGLNTGSPNAAVEIQLNLVDYQTRGIRRRLEVTPSGVVMGQTYLVYDGTNGGGMFQGNIFRISETAASRQWAMMSFDTLNKAADGELTVARQNEQVENNVRYYVIDVKFSSSDTIQYWINERDFLIYKAITKYNGKTMVEEVRTDYRKVSCIMLPFRIVTKLQGQPLADLTISQYDLETAVPTTYFTVTVNP